MTVDSYKKAKELFLKGDLEQAESYFLQNKAVLEYAYCRLLSGDIDNAKQLFMRISSMEHRADWATRLIQFIEGYVRQVPTYFQIRNFLEIDLNFLINAKRPEYVENIINGADIFYSVNQESYKFISRVMLNNDFHTVAQYYLLRAKDKFYNDPEMHLLLAQCYKKESKMDLAVESAQNCLKILPQYLPAKKFLENLN